VGEPNDAPIRFDFNRSIEMSFTGGEITSDAGVLLLRRLDEALGLTSSLAASLHDPRDPEAITHPLVELLRERLYLLCLGYEDTIDARTMRHDPALKLAVRGPGAEAFRDPLGSQPTVSRLEHEILLPRDACGNLTAEALRNLAVLEDAPLGWTERVLARHKPPARLTLDLDSSEDRAYGAQEGAAYNGYFGHVAFHPLFAHLGDGLGELVKVQLRPGNVYTSDGVVDFVRPLLPRLLAVTGALWVRGDSGFAVPDLFEHVEGLDARERRATPEKRAFYVIKLKSNAVLQRLAEPHCRRGVGRPPNHPVRKYVELRYRADSWSRDRRVVLEVTFKPGELFPETAFIATNLTEEEASGEEVFAFYRRRGDDSENRIKEAKLDLKVDRTSCHSFESNRVRLALTTLAYQIAHWTRTLGRSAVAADEDDPADDGRGEPPSGAPSIGTLRLLVLKIGARLLLHARRAYLLAASACPAQALFRAIHARLGVLADATTASLARVPLSIPSTG